MSNDTVPGAHAKELGENTGWELWTQAVQAQDKQYNHTAPMTALAPAEGGDRRYARTEPGNIPHSAARPVPADVPKFTLDEVVAVSRAGNRMCPRPTRWHQLYIEFTNWAPAGTALPARPPNGQVWRTTPALAKRMMFRDHIEWADAHGCLAQVMLFLQSLPEEHWYHIGD